MVALPPSSRNVPAPRIAVPDSSPGSRNSICRHCRNRRGRGYRLVIDSRWPSPIIGGATRGLIMMSGGGQGHRVSPYSTLRRLRGPPRRTTCRRRAKPPRHRSRHRGRRGPRPHRHDRPALSRPRRCCRGSTAHPLSTASSVCAGSPACATATAIAATSTARPAPSIACSTARSRRRISAPTSAAAGRGQRLPARRTTPRSARGRCAAAADAG